MCIGSTPKVTAPQAAPPPPAAVAAPPPEQVTPVATAIDSARDTNKKAGRSALRIDRTTSAGSDGGSGLNIPV